MGLLHRLWPLHHLVEPDELAGAFRLVLRPDLFHRQDAFAHRLEARLKSLAIIGHLLGEASFAVWMGSRSTTRRELDFLCPAAPAERVWSAARGLPRSILSTGQLRGSVARKSAPAPSHSLFRRNSLSKRTCAIDRKSFGDSTWGFGLVFLDPV